MWKLLSRKQGDTEKSTEEEASWSACSWGVQINGERGGMLLHGEVQMSLTTYWSMRGVCGALRSSEPGAAL